MDIAIIRTPAVIPKKHVTSMTAVPDIGTASLSAYLKQLGHRVCLIDAQGLAIDQLTEMPHSSFFINGLLADEIVEKIPASTQVVLVSCMHSNRWVYDAKIIQLIIDYFPQVKIIVGGEHATACAKEVLLQFPQIYAVCRGEGEETLRELIESLEESQDDSRHKILGISYIDRGEYSHHADRPRIENLDSLPFPDWSEVPVENYLSRFSGINSLHYRSMPIITSRGCPYSCHFCTCKTMWYSKWHPRQVDLVIDEIELLKERYQLDHVDIIDLTLSLDSKWVRNFAEKLIERKSNIAWSLPIGTRTEGLTYPLLELLQRAGLKRVLFASETGSKKTAKAIGKQIDLDHFYKVISWASQLGIIVKITLILGFPDQRLSQLLASFKLLVRAAFCGVRDVVCLCFVPYPNTYFFSKLGVRYNYNSLHPRDNININNDIPHMRSWSQYYSDRTLKFFVIFFTLFFYAIQFLFRPWRAIEAVARIFWYKRPLTNFESIVYNLFVAKKKTVRKDDE